MKKKPEKKSVAPLPEWLAQVIDVSDPVRKDQKIRMSREEVLIQAAKSRAAIAHFKRTVIAAYEKGGYKDVVTELLLTYGELEMYKGADHKDRARLVLGEDLAEFAAFQESQPRINFSSRASLNKRKLLDQGVTAAQITAATETKEIKELDWAGAKTEEEGNEEEESIAFE